MSTQNALIRGVVTALMLGENEYILGKVPQNLRVEGLCSLVWTQAARCGGSTDIVVKQTGREGCLHTVEIQTEIQV